jgi:hypothetical protein
MIELLAAGTKADFMAATHDYPKLAHLEAGIVR